MFYISNWIRVYKIIIETSLHSHLALDRIPDISGVALLVTHRVSHVSYSVRC